MSAWIWRNINPSADRPGVTHASARVAIMLLYLGTGCLRPAMNEWQSRWRKGRPVLQGPPGLQGHLDELVLPD